MNEHNTPQPVRRADSPPVLHKAPPSNSCVTNQRSDQELPDDIRKILETRQPRSDLDVFRHLSGIWERIQHAHDHTTSATALRDEDLYRDFWLIALRDLADIRQAAEEAVQRLISHMSNELNIASRTLADVAKVSPSTALRWSRTRYEET